MPRGKKRNPKAFLTTVGPEDSKQTPIEIFESTTPVEEELGKGLLPVSNHLGWAHKFYPRADDLRLVGADLLASVVKALAGSTYRQFGAA